MKISVFGLGYVGCVSLGAYYKLGNRLVGVDIDSYKIELINKGIATVIEKDLDELIKNGVNDKKIIATSDHTKAVLESNISIICVGTPATEEGNLNLEYVFNVVEQIAITLKKKQNFHTIAIRSTVLPGTNEKIINLIEEISGKKHDEDFAVVSNPEFLREGTAVYDFFNPPYIALASYSQKGIDVMKKLHKDITDDIIVASVKSVEMIKYVNNSFHALKVAFANEVGRICKKMNIDSIELMEMFKKDKILNISEYYLTPWFAYGGSCLPKDLKGLKRLSRDYFVSTPIIDSIQNSNDDHIDFAYNLINKNKSRKIGFLGLSFKSGTDDLRFSPVVLLIEKLIGKGYKIKIFDKDVYNSTLIGKNKEYIRKVLPHFSELMKSSPEEAMEKCDVIVISKKEYSSQVNNYEDKKIISLVKNNEKIINNNNEGIVW